jgi:hypothetical protein
MTSSHDVAGRPHYYSRMAVEPDNENQLYFLTGRPIRFRPMAARRCACCADNRAPWW